MLLEIRRYEIVPGRLDEFVAFFDNEVEPEMRKAGMKVIGQFTSVDEENVFFYLRSFAGEDERAAQSEAFYSGRSWLDDLKDRAIEMETGWNVEVVTPTPGSAIF